MGRFIEKGDKPWLWGGGGIVAGLAIGFAIAHVHTLQEWRWDIIAQPLATLGAGIAAIIAAWIALHNGKETREQDKEIHEAKSRAEQERILRERFTSIVELLATDDLTKRESGLYMLAALANDWAYFYEDSPYDALVEQPICLNTMIGQLRDEIGENSDPNLLKFKHMVQNIIITKFENEEEKISDSTEGLELDFRHCHLHDFSLRGFFKEITLFDQAHFHGKLIFNDATFEKIVSFDGAYFHGGLYFDNANLFKASAIGAQFLSLGSIEGIKFLKEVGADLDGAVIKINFPDNSLEE